jgi:hypothetical protein
LTEIAPSERWPSGFAALKSAIEGATSLSVAVAFVTEPGVAKLAALLEPLEGLELEVVARAGGVTTPEALYALRDRLAAPAAPGFCGHV